MMNRLWRSLMNIISPPQPRHSSVEPSVQGGPRGAFRIVLNEFASALSGNSQQTVYSVFSYLAQQIRKRTEQEVSADDIKQWLANYPSLFVFDGLDEVPSSSNRDQVLESIRDFWVEVDPKIRTGG